MEKKKEERKLIDILISKRNRKCFETLQQALEKTMREVSFPHSIRNKNLIPILSFLSHDYFLKTGWVLMH